MSASIHGIKKRRGRPKTTGSGVQIGVRWQPHMIDIIDKWAAEQPDAPERAEAIRRLTMLGAAATMTESTKKPRRQK